MKTIINLFKTGLLFSILTALLLAVGYLIGGPDALWPFFIISVVMNLVGYWFSASIALKMAHAKPLSETDAPEIHREVRELASTMNMPMPKLYVSEDAQPNAFATGRGPRNGVVCVTRGLMRLLDHNEIRGVLAHELGHIKNRDVLTGTLAAIMAGLISTIAQMSLYIGSDEDEGRNPIVAILSVILVPIAAMLIQMAISRTRELAADESGAYATKEPMALASALQKIEQAAKQLPIRTNPALSSLYIQNPFKGHGMLEWFSTHPSTAKRVARLEALKKEIGGV
jgi:heat shock protein HtpX